MSAMRTTLSYAACALLAVVAFAGTGCTTTTSNGPTIQAVTPSVTTNADLTYTLTLVVDFDDSVSGDLVDAYTFQTSDGQVNDVDVPLGGSYGSPFTITGVILPADYAGRAGIAFHLALYGASTGLGSVFDGTVTVN
jgi:hypothetical protein